MNLPPKKKLKMRKLSSRELGPFRLDLMSMLAGSPDPFVFVRYTLAIGPCKQLARDESLKTGKKITLTHVLNKLLAVAIAENPVFNQVILGSSVYQIEEIHIANAYLVPGKEHVVTYLLLDNPHLKSLETIREELKILQEEKIRSYEKPVNVVLSSLLRLCYRMRLFRLVGEKRIFVGSLERGLLSNIIFLNQVYNSKPATFLTLKPVVTIMKIPVRIHAHGAVQQPFVENGKVRIREILPLHVATDHRILHGIHAHRFGESLERIASDPEKHLL